VAASFDVALAEQNGVVVGREARALGIDVALQPYVNIDRMHVPLRQLQSWSTARHRWVKVAGRRILSLGASSRDLRLQQAIGAE
jgi:hypothetical protein